MSIHAPEPHLVLANSRLKLVLCPKYPVGYGACVAVFCMAVFASNRAETSQGQGS